MEPDQVTEMKFGIVAVGKGAGLLYDPNVEKAQENDMSGSLAEKSRKSCNSYRHELFQTERTNTKIAANIRFRKITIIKTESTRERQYLITSQILPRICYCLPTMTSFYRIKPVTVTFASKNYTKNTAGVNFSQFSSTRRRKHEDYDER